MEGYDQYQKIKNRTKILVGKLRLNVVLEQPWQYIYILVDFIIKLLVLRGYNLILVICDRFLKMLHFIMTIEKITVEELVRLFRNNM